MSFTPSGSSHLQKEQRCGWHGSRSLEWNLSGEPGLEWQVGLEKAGGRGVQGRGAGGKVSWGRSHLQAPLHQRAQG